MHTDHFYLIINILSWTSRFCDITKVV